MIIAIVVSLTIFFGIGLLPSYIRHTTIQRTWLLTLLPFCLLIYIIFLDGEYLVEGEEITKLVALMAIIFGCFWYVTNWLDKRVGSISLRKGDAELKIGGGESKEADHSKDNQET